MELGKWMTIQLTGEGFRADMRTPVLGKEGRRPGEGLRCPMHPMAFHDYELCESSRLGIAGQWTTHRDNMEDEPTFFTSSRPITHSPRLQTSALTSHPTSIAFPTILRPGMNPVPFAPLTVFSCTRRESSESSPTAKTCTKTWEDGTNDGGGRCDRNATGIGSVSRRCAGVMDSLPLPFDFLNLGSSWNENVLLFFLGPDDSNCAAPRVTSTVAMLVCARPARTKSIFPSFIAAFLSPAYAACGNVSPEYPWGVDELSDWIVGAGMECVGSVWEKENKVGDIDRESRRVFEYDFRGCPSERAYACTRASGVSDASSLDDGSRPERWDWERDTDAPCGNTCGPLSCEAAGSSWTGDGARLGSALLPPGVISLYSLSSSSSKADMRPRLDRLPRDRRDDRFLWSADGEGGGYDLDG